MFCYAKYITHICVTKVSDVTKIIKKIQLRLSLTQNLIKMVFANIRNQATERARIVKLLMEKTQTSESVVYRWLSGQITPPPIKQRIIAEVLGRPIEELFPKND